MKVKSKFYNDMVGLGYFDPESEKYFWVCEMEWLTAEKAEEYSDDVPGAAFAITGGGDVYYEEDGRVYLQYCGEDEGEEFADSIENAVFKAIVIYLSDSDFDPSGSEADEYSESYGRQCAKNALEIFGGYWTVEQRKAMEKISTVPLTEYTDGNYKHKSFLSAEEAEALADGCPETVSPGADSDISNDCETDFISDEKLEELRAHCLDIAKKYAGSGDELSKAALSRKDNGNLQEMFYKNGCQDVFVTRPNIVMNLGTMDEGTKKETVEECKRQFIKYYLDQKGEPVFSEDYYKPDKPPMTRTFYFKEAGRIISAEYRLMEDGGLLLMHFNENTYDSSGRITSFLSYDEEEAYLAEYYIYTDGTLQESVCTENMALAHDLGTDVYEEFGEKRDNPRCRLNYRYIYEKGAIVGMTVRKLCKNEITTQKYDVAKKAYNALVKRKLI